MVDYTKYHDKTIRNKTNLNPEEQAYAEMLVQQQVDKLLAQFGNEPKFLRDVTYKLASRIVGSGERE